MKYYHINWENGNDKMQYFDTNTKNIVVIDNFDSTFFQFNKDNVIFRF